MMERIKKCPMCGGAAVIRSWCISGKELYNPYCPNCHLTFHSDGECPEGYPILYATKELAISSWNSREVNEELATLRAELDAVKRERDAAVADMQRVGYKLGACCACKYPRDGEECNKRNAALPDDFDAYCGDPCTCFEWRGVQEAPNADQTAQE